MSAPPNPTRFNYPDAYSMPSPSGPPNFTPDVGGFQYMPPSQPLSYPPQDQPPSNLGPSQYYLPQGPPPQLMYDPPPYPPPDLEIPVFYLSVPLLSDPRNPYPPPIPTSLPNYPPDRITTDVNTIASATKGMGTDETALSRLLCGGGPRPWIELEVLKEAWKRRDGRELEDTLKKELSGWLEFGLVGRVKGPVGFDLWLIEKACSGIGTKEEYLTEVLIGRNPQDMEMLKTAYKIAHKGSALENRVKSELSMKTERMFLMALQSRHEDLIFGQPPNLHSIDLHDLQVSLRTGKTDEMKVCSIILNRSPQYLNQLQAQFYQATGNTLTKMIKKHFASHMESALLYALEGAKKDVTGAWRTAKMLEKSMKGMGTKDEQLVYRLLRASWDWEYLKMVKEAYRIKYKKSLRDRVKGETSGKYREMLLTILGND